jgi:hypothetical protein
MSNLINDLTKAFPDQTEFVVFTQRDWDTIRGIMKNHPIAYKELEATGIELMPFEIDMT